MKAPHFRIAWLMALVALAAIDSLAIRLLFYDLPTGRNNNRLEVLALGALPMANVLAVGGLLALRFRHRRAFLLGFVGFGVAALALYLLVWTFYADEWVRRYVFSILNPLRRVVGYLQPDALNYAFYASVVVVLLGWPQMAFALVGGFVSRRFGPRGAEPNSATPR